MQKQTKSKHRHTCTHTRTHTLTYTQTHTRTHASTHTHTHTYTHTHIHTHKHTHTHTHTHTQPNPTPNEPFKQTPRKTRHDTASFINVCKSSSPFLICQTLHRPALGHSDFTSIPISVRSVHRIRLTRSKLCRYVAALST